MKILTEMMLECSGNYGMVQMAAIAPGERNTFNVLESV